MCQGPVALSASFVTLMKLVKTTKLKKLNEKTTRFMFIYRRVMTGHGLPAQRYVWQGRAAVEGQIWDAALLLAAHQVAVRRCARLLHNARTKRKEGKRTCCQLFRVFLTM